MADFKTYRIDDTEYPRVTQIIKCTKDDADEKKMLRWMHKLYSLHPRANNKPNDMQRGTKAHRDIELFLKRDILPDPFSADFKMIFPYLVNIYKPIIVAVEKTVVSKNHGYAGKMDALAAQKGLMIIDWMTSYRFKKKEWVHHKFLQTTAYAIAYQEMTGIPISRIRVVAISRKVQEFTDIPANFRDEWLNRLEKFQKVYKNLNPDT